MKLVILESPYAGEIERNTIYARRAMRDCIERGEAPFASHLLYTQPGILDENNPEERKLGIEAGYEWWSAVTKIVFYADYGFSNGMMGALEKVSKEKDELNFEIRKIGLNP